MLGLPKRTFLLSLLVVVGFILLTQFTPFTTRFYPGVDLSNQPLSSPSASTTPSPATGSATPSAQTVVDPKKIAEKVDFSRKLIRAEEKNLAKLESEISKSGGKIIKKEGSLVVVDLPDEKTNEIAKNLQDSGLTKNLETDYPAYLSAESIDWGVQKVEAEAVWSVNKGTGIKIAVIDTGLDYGHPDLRENYIGGYDFANKDADPADDHGHGTHVSGTIASALNQTGLVGVAPQAKILAVKVLDSQGLGYISDLISGINYAISQGAQVINLSLGTTYDSSLLEEAVDNASSHGIIIVAAAGNNSAGPLLYPAAYSSVISVAAINQNNELASFSAVGAELSAPGVAITSTVPGNGYASWSGTSMAAPHVSAAAAMLISNKVSNVRERLRESSTDLGSPGRDSSFGYGLINLKTAFNNPDTTAPLITFLSPENNDSVKGTVTIKFEAKDENGVTNAELWLNNDLKLASWVNPPYEYNWDYSGLSGTQELIAKAGDPSGNVGSAKVSVTIKRPTARLAPPVSSPTAQPEEETSEATSTPNFGRSFEVRKDLENENAREHRRNFEKQEKETQSSPSASPAPSQSSQIESKIEDSTPASQVPEFTNLGKRAKRGDKDNRIKGLKTYLR